MKTLPIIQQHYKINEIIPILNQTIDHLFKNFYYDRSVYYLETDLNPLEIIDPSKYHFDSLTIFKKYGTADCVGIARKIQDDLKELFRMQLIPATAPIARYQPNMPKCTHPGLIIWCQDGYILIDPAMNIPDLIVFKETEQVTLNLGVKGQWKYILDLNNKKIEVLKNSASEKKSWSKQRQLENKFEYYLEEIIDPDRDMLIPHFIFDRNVLICPFCYPNEIYYFMVIKVNLKLIEYCYLTYNGVKTILSIPFEVYYNQPKKLDVLITESIAKSLKIPKEMLIYRISNVIDRVRVRSQDTWPYFVK